MRRTPTRSNVSRGQLYLAGVLLLGVLLLAYGYFQQSKVGLYVGLLVIVAGVLNGILRIVIQGNR